jgi:hypothetical protein
MNWYVSLFIKTHARYMKLPLKIWKWKRLVVVQCCMRCNDILHYFCTNSISCHSYEYNELFLQKTCLIELLRLFYGIPVAGVMCNGTLDLRKLSKNVVWLQQWKQFTKPTYIHHYSLFTFIHTLPALNVNWYRISENCRRPEYAVAELMSKDFIPIPIANTLYSKSRIIN